MTFTATANGKNNSDFVHFAIFLNPFGAELSQKMRFLSLNQFLAVMTLNWR